MAGWLQSGEGAFRGMPTRQRRRWKRPKLLLGEFRGGAVETCPQHHATAPQRTVLK
jgi:hypothetical protein